MQFLGVHFFEHGIHHCTISICSQGSSQVASQASVVASSVVGIIDYPQWRTLKADALYDVLTEDSSVACWKKSWLPIGVVLIAAISRKIIMKA